MSIGKDHAWHYYNRAAVDANVPATSGVYAVFRPREWIYIGESGDLPARMLQHLNGDNPRITQENPTGFQFEQVPEHQRVARQNHLIATLNPIANRRLG